MNKGDIVINTEDGELYEIIDSRPGATEALIKGIHNGITLIRKLNKLIPAPPIPLRAPAATPSARPFGVPAAIPSARPFGMPRPMPGMPSARPFGMPRPMPGMPSARPMPSFALGETVYVGTRPYRIEAINPATYTLSPNLGSGGAGGASVNVPKEYVTQLPNYTPQGERWLNLVDAPEPVEEGEVIRDLTGAKCNINRKVKDEFVKLSTMDTRVEFDIQAVVKIAKTMFGYGDDILYMYNSVFAAGTERGEVGILNKPNREYNAKYFKMRSGKPVSDRDPDLMDARQMERTFKKAIDSEIFTTGRHGIVYRSFAKGVSSAEGVCGTLNRFTSTTLAKNYADKWGTDIDEKTGKPNEEGFFTTIIIPAGTRSIIPLLLFDDLSMKQRQYEVLLSPDGILKDTGFTDPGGSKIMIYVERDKCSTPIRDLLRMELRGTNILGFIQCVFGDQVDYVGPTGGKTRRKKSRKYKTKRV